MPLVSVIIPVFNRERFVVEAIGSVLAQTLADFEIVVIDDGSTDGTAAAVQAIRDPRIRLVPHGVNCGLATARNTGLDEARGEFIAWLDSDDLSRPRRLEAQVAFLRANPKVALTGCCAGKIRVDGTRKPGTRVPPLASADIAAWLLFRSAFQASGIMGRAAIMQRYRHSTESTVCEDVDFYIKLSAGHPLRNMPRVLIDRRIHDGQMVRTLKQEIKDRKAELIAPQLRRMGMAFTPEELRRHVALGKSETEEIGEDTGSLDWIEGWLLRLRAANDQSGVLDRKGLALASGFFWAINCKAAIPSIGAARAVKAFATSPLSAGLASSHGAALLRQALPLILGGGR